MKKTYVSLFKKGLQSALFIARGRLDCIVQHGIGLPHAFCVERINRQPVDFVGGVFSEEITMSFSWGGGDFILCFTCVLLLSGLQAL